MKLAQDKVIRKRSHSHSPHVCLEYEVNSKITPEGTRESKDSRNVFQKDRQNGVGVGASHYQSGGNKMAIN